MDVNVLFYNNNKRTILLNSLCFYHLYLATLNGKQK